MNICKGREFLRRKQASAGCLGVFQNNLCRWNFYRKIIHTIAFVAISIITSFFMMSKTILNSHQRGWAILESFKNL